LKPVQALLGRLPHLLAPNSPVLLIGLHPAHWIDQVAGQSADWWAKNSDGMPQSPQLSPEQLVEQLAYLDFTDNQIHHSATEGLAGIYLIHARSPKTAFATNAEPTSQNWLIISGSDDPEQTLAHQLGQQLHAQGQHITYNHARWSLAEKLDDFQHIVNLSGFAQSDINLQLQRCNLAGQIIKPLKTPPTAQ